MQNRKNLRCGTESHQILEFGLQLVFACFFMFKSFKNLRQRTVGEAKIVIKILEFEQFQRRTVSNKRFSQLGLFCGGEFQLFQ